METWNRFSILVLSLLLLSSCGVKSRPLPPDVPAPLGRGEPTKAPEAKKKQKNIQNKYNEKSEGQE